MRINSIRSYNFNTPGFCGYTNQVNNKDLLNDYNNSLRARIPEEKLEIFPEQKIKAQLKNFYFDPYSYAISDFEDSFNDSRTNLVLTYDNNILTGELTLTSDPAILNVKGKEAPTEVNYHKIIQWNVAEDPFGFDKFKSQVYDTDKKFRMDAIEPTLTENQKYDVDYDAIETYNNRGELRYVQIGEYGLSINYKKNIIGVEDISRDVNFVQSKEYPNIWNKNELFADGEVYCVRRVDINKVRKLRKYMDAKWIKPIVLNCHIEFQEQEERFREMRREYEYYKKYSK
jgi:hypothetical protein